MDPVEKAKETHQLRLEALECQKRFRESNSTDLDALECYIASYRRATEIHPSPMLCPECYFNYGVGLRLYGIYHWERLQEARQTLEDAPDSERAAREQTVRAHEREVERYYKESISKFESYVATRQAIDPRTYDWLSQQYAYLDDYRRALQYLGLLEANAPLSRSDAEVIAQRRNHYKRELERQQFERIRNSIDRIPDGREEDGTR